MAAPTVTAVSPNFGPMIGGTSIAVTGSGFTSSPPLTLTIGNLPALNVVITSDTALTAVTPDLGVPAAGNVVATNAAGISPESVANAFYFLDATTVPNGLISALNPYFDPTPSYIVFGNWTFEGQVNMTNLAGSPPGGSVAVMWNPTTKQFYHA